MTSALSQFKKEIVNFYLISLINIIFAALAIAFGVQHMVTAIIGLPEDPAITGLRMISGVVAMICFGLGIRWLLSTLKVFEGIEAIKDILCSSGDTITEDRITCLIVRMLAHYRDNRKTIQTMILVSTIGGCFFFLLGIATSLEALSISANGITISLNNLMVIPAMVLTLGIALASLLSSYYFSKFAKVWDRRLHEIDASECTLKRTLGLDGP